MYRMLKVSMVTVVLLSVVFMAMFTEMIDFMNGDSRHVTGLIANVPAFFYLSVLVSLGMGIYLCIKERKE
ncbi:hypothetical protein [Aneurinibacillus sp. REN35]|uniref:hypothetical protein n=1 Tax=Aneurinibacillus sp. REN35 TaxID=3237286 RepID=UPI0035299516